MWRNRRRTAAAAGAVAVLAVTSIWLVQAGLALPGRASASPIPLERSVLGELFYSPRFARAEVVVMVGTQPQVVRIDRGRVRAVSAGAISLVERDGTNVTIPISPTAVVRVNGRYGAVHEIRRAWLVMTARTGDAPADAVEARRR